MQVSDEHAARERRAARVTTRQIDALIEQLERCSSLRTACKRAGVQPADLRWLRYGDSAIRRRVDAARVKGLRNRATWHRQKAAAYDRKAQTISSW